MTSLVLSGCGLQVLAPPPAPPRVIPQLAEAPMAAPEGTTPVSIDADMPARVYEHWQDICVTPCVANLAPGVHDLHFRPEDPLSGRDGDPAITVGDRPMAFRYEMAYTEDNSGWRVGGALLLILGGTVGTTGAALAIGSETRRAGEVVGIAAGAAIVAGIVMLVEGRDVVRHGAGTQWTPSDGRIYTLDR
jgi:hypothetical protein